MRGILFACLAILLAAPVVAQEKKLISGVARALNGDTLVVFTGEAIKVRLWGVKAPDLGNWPWGPLARAALDNLFTKNTSLVICEQRGKSQGLIVATCSTKAKKGREGGDLGSYMISLGLAIENRTHTSPGPGSIALFYINPYEPWETNARIRRLGVWSDPTRASAQPDSKPLMVPKLGSKPGKN